MDDEFLKRYYATPRAEFSQNLYERINRQMNTQTVYNGHTSLWRWGGAFLAAALVIATLLLVTLAPARALAQDFLNLFRVKKFAAITIDPARLEQFESGEINWEQLWTENVQVVKEAGKPQKVADPDEASRRVGFPLRVPTELLGGDVALETYVQDEGLVTFTVDTAKLQAILDALGVGDAQIPTTLDGAQITVRKPAIAILQYTLRNDTMVLMQARSPEVELPPGVNLAELGEIGLRALGLSKSEAHTFAQSIDWNSTFLIPLPANAAEFRQVEMNGVSGLMIVANRAPKHSNPIRRGEAVILWAKGGFVYAMYGSASVVDLLEIANSVK